MHSFESEQRENVPQGAGCIFWFGKSLSGMKSASIGSSISRLGRLKSNKQVSNQVNLLRSFFLLVVLFVQICGLQGTPLIMSSHVTRDSFLVSKYYRYLLKYFVGKYLST